MVKRLEPEPSYQLPAAYPISRRTRVQNSTRLCVVFEAPIRVTELFCVSVTYRPDHTPNAEETP